MNEHGKANLVQITRKMISLIEQDHDYIGEFFEEGVNQIRVKRITTSQNEITTIHTYGFDIEHDGDGVLNITDAWKQEEVVNDDPQINGPSGAIAPPSIFSAPSAVSPAQSFNSTLNPPCNRIISTRRIELGEFKQNGDKDE